MALSGGSRDWVRDLLIPASLAEALKADELHQNWDLKEIPSRGPFAPEPPGDIPDIRTPGASVHPEFKTATVTLHPSGKKLNVLVADTPALRQIGVQNRDDVGMANGTYDGMLFQWSEDTNAAMHAKNVTFPVSIAWFTADGMWRDHAHLLPGQRTAVKPSGPHRYALEVHSDDFDSLGIGPNSRISLHQEKNPEKNPTINLGS